MCYHLLNKMLMVRYFFVSNLLIMIIVENLFCYDECSKCVDLVAYVYRFNSYACADRDGNYDSYIFSIA